MAKMKIFKLKNSRGDFTEKKDKLISRVNVPGIIGHTSKYIANKIPTIPRAAEFSDLAIEGEYITANVELNEFGKKFASNGVVKNVSVEIDQNDTITAVGMLGAEFPEIKDLDTLEKALEFSEVENNTIIEFEEGNMTLEEVKSFISSATTSDLLEIVKSIKVDNSDKEAMRKLVYEFAEENELEVKEKEKEVVETKEEIEARVRNEVLAENEKKELEKEKERKIKEAVNEFSEKMKILPAQKENLEILLNAIDDSKVKVKEFSENGKIEEVEKSKLDLMIEFQRDSLKSFEHLTKGTEFSEKKEKGLNDILSEIKKRNNGGV